MTHVIGLFSFEVDGDRPVLDLRTRGFHPETIGLKSREQVVMDVLGKASWKIIAIYTGGGAFLGLVIYGVAALFASWCQCNLFYYGQVVQLGTFLGGVLAGVFVGGSLGVFAGVAKLDEVTALYYQGKRIDGKLIDVRVNSDQADHVKDVLQRDGAYDVRIV